jgi:hypothetical protein
MIPRVARNDVNIASTHALVKSITDARPILG